MAPTMLSVPRLLDLDYAPGVPHDLLAQMEKVCKAAGLPLAQMELLGQDTQSVREFVHMAHVVGVDAAVHTTDWLWLEERWASRHALN